MKVVHEHPNYKEGERKRKVKETYENIQQILYNDRKDKNSQKNINSSQK